MGKLLPKQEKKAWSEIRAGRNERNVGIRQNSKEIQDRKGLWVCAREWLALRSVKKSSCNAILGENFSSLIHWIFIIFQHVSVFLCSFFLLVKYIHDVDVQNYYQAIPSHANYITPGCICLRKMTRIKMNCRQGCEDLNSLH